jgi:hypothetical protein
MRRGRDIDLVEMNRSWLKVWVIAIVLVGGLAAAYEGLLRTRHYVPTVQDDADLWSLQYDLVQSDPHAVALLGASRIQFALDPALLSALLGGRTVAMLAINGQYPLAALRALADDRNFAGLAVVGIDARGLRKRHWDMQQAHLNHFRDRWSLARRIHRRIESGLQERLVFMRAPFSAANIAQRFLAGFGMPFNEYVVLRPDRVGFIDYRHTDVAAIKARRVADLEAYYREFPPPPPEVWLRDLTEVSAWVRRIEARGGRVVFFREPATGEHLDIDERAFPRELYWDAYARVAPATMIEFRDEPVFANFRLPDTSHIDGVDVPAFTIAFAQVLERHKLVPPLTNLPGLATPPM